MKNIIYTPFFSEKRNHFQEITPRGYTRHYTSNDVDNIEEVTNVTEVSDQEVQEEIDFSLPDINYRFPDQNSFKNRMLQEYRSALDARGLNPDFAKYLVAQDALETGWGSSPVGLYNYGNITGSSGKSLTVPEFIDGQWENKDQTFKNYSSISEFVNDKIDLLSNRRYNVFNHPVTEFVTRVTSGGYATAPNYAYELNRVIASMRKGGVLKFDGGGYLSRNSQHYNRVISSGLPFGYLPSNVTKHQIRLSNSADNKDHENEIVVRNLSKEIRRIMDKWGNDMFNSDISYDFNYDTPEELGLRMLNYYESSGYIPRSTRDTIRFVNDEQKRYITNASFDSNGNSVITYNDPNNIYNRYSTGFINDMLQLFYGVSKKQFGGIIKKYNSGGPMSWTLSSDWHAPLLPIYINSRPDAESSVLGFNKAKEVYEHILSLPGSNPAIAAGWTGVFMKESGLDHNAINSSSGASGIAQLLGSRRNEYNRWLKGRPDNWQNQISWVWEKVNSGKDDWQVYYDALRDKVDRGITLSDEEARHWNSMKNSKYRNYSFQSYRDKINTMRDPADIAELMTWTFERPGNNEAHIDQRREYANAVYNQFN